jgi:diacylglycerol kinase (ATP)
LSADVRVVLNPVAGRGRAAQMAAAVRAAFTRRGVTTFVETRCADDEGRVVAEAAAGGCRTLVAVGGDGTWSKLADAIARLDGSMRLALVPAGTGSDLAKCLDLPPGDAEAWARIAVEGRPRRIDLGWIEGRHFLNALGFGLDVAVLQAMTRIRFLRGEWAYLWCALRQVLTCRRFPVTVTVSNGAGAIRSLLMLVIANGHSFGGSFRVAPGADLSDGRLDLVSFGDGWLVRRLALLARVRAGRHLACREVTVERAASFRLSFDAPPAYEVDGEVRRAASAELEVVTRVGALEVLTPA